MEAEGTNSEASSTTARGSADHVRMLHSPCYWIQEAVKAMVKCLGFDDSVAAHHGSSCPKDEKSSCIPEPTSCQDQPYTGPDPRSDLPPGASARRGSIPPRPEVSGGRDPQTNSAPSS